MACNSCSKSFSLFRPEKGCPSCGFSYCSKCLNNKIFLPKLNSKTMVCTKCTRSINSNEPKKIEPPDAYYKRIGITENIAEPNELTSKNLVETEISERLKKLKADKEDKMVSNEDVAGRLQKLKGEVPSTSDAELRSRLANIKGVPLSAVQSKPAPIIPANYFQTEQEQVDNLMKQYMEQGNIDKQYERNFDDVISNIEDRLQKLKGSQSSEPIKGSMPDYCSDSEDEDKTVKKIIEKVKAEAKLENRDIDSVMDELPFCEICNEDAKMRCLGCKYLFCKQCFKEHEDSDDGCDKYELYCPP